MRPLISPRASSLTLPERFDNPAGEFNLSRCAIRMSNALIDSTIIAASYFGIASNDIYLKLGYARTGLCD
jgi:hypothetical protein